VGGGPGCGARFRYRLCRERMGRQFLPGFGIRGQEPFAGEGALTVVAAVPLQAERGAGRVLPARQALKRERTWGAMKMEL